MENIATKILEFVTATATVWIPLTALIICYALVLHWSRQSINHLDKKKERISKLSDEVNRLLDLDEHEMHLS